jgi:hypothetical protein
MFARRCERRCRKKKRIVNILKISLNVQDPVFFWAAHRLAALACLFRVHDSLPVDVSLQRFPFGRTAPGFYFHDP